MNTSRPIPVLVVIHTWYRIYLYTHLCSSVHVYRKHTLLYSWVYLCCWMFQLGMALTPQDHKLQDKSAIQDDEFSNTWWEYKMSMCDENAPIFLQNPFLALYRSYVYLNVNVWMWLIKFEHKRLNCIWTHDVILHRNCLTPTPTQESKPPEW